jgi:hypothetical protein
VVEQDLIGTWNCININQEKSLLVDVYSRFLNEIWTSSHIAFYTQTHMVIDQVVNGDVAFDIRGDLSKLMVKVERVVDIVQNVFKMSSALSVLEGTTLLEVPYP